MPKKYNITIHGLSEVLRARLDRARIQPDGSILPATRVVIETLEKALPPLPGEQPDDQDILGQAGTRPVPAASLMMDAIDQDGESA